MSDGSRPSLQDADTALASASRALSDGDWPAVEAAYLHARALYQSMNLVEKVAYCDKRLRELQRSQALSQEAVAAQDEPRTSFELWAW